jgi:hypothetical protein
MARRDFPLNIDRRRLLATGAAVVTAAIALRADRVDVALADTVQISALIEARGSAFEFLRCHGSPSSGNRPA